MNIFLLADPYRPTEFARFGNVGTWSDDVECGECGHHSQKLVEPLLVEWDEGTDRIGSFSWCSYTCVVTADVRAFMERQRVDCRFGQIEVVPPEKRQSSKPRVAFPYTGPHLQWLIPLCRVSLNEKQSGLSLERDCRRCGYKQYSFKREGLIIEADQIGSSELFLIDQFGSSSAKFVTGDFLAKLKAKGFSNLAPHLAGEIV